MVLAKETLYRDQNFADGFIELLAMPAQYGHRIRRLPGITQVTGRLIHDVQLHDPDRAEGIYLRLVSLDMQEADRLNDVRLLDGEPLVAGALTAWVASQFYDEHNLEPGQTLEIIAGGRARDLMVMGKGISPEFVYPLRTEADIMPNPERFGIAFVPQETMWLATPITSLLYHFFHLPPVYMGFSWKHLGISFLICFGILGFAGYQGCKSVLQLTPVEAMMPPAPAHGKHFWLEALPLLTSLLTVQGRMGMRNVSRSRSRTAFVFFGLMAGCALVAFTWALAFEAMPMFMFYQYEAVQAHDVKVALGEPRPRDAARRELERFAGVSRVEPVAEAPVTLWHRWRREHVMLMGIPPDARLYNILDVDGRQIVPGDDGLILSERLAYKLGARVGDTLRIESIYLRDPEDDVVADVAAIVPQYIGMNAYTGIAWTRTNVATAVFRHVAPGGIRRRTGGAKSDPHAARIPRQRLRHRRRHAHGAGANHDRLLG